MVMNKVSKLLVINSFVNNFYFTLNVSIFIYKLLNISYTWYTSL